MKVRLAPPSYPYTLLARCEHCQARIEITVENEADRRLWLREGALCPDCAAAQAAARDVVEG